MNQNYEGSVAELGTEDWSEPFDVVAPTPEIAAQKVLKLEATEGLIDGRTYSVCVREISPVGLPLSGWLYFKGSVNRVYQATVEALHAKPTRRVPMFAACLCSTFYKL